MDPRKHTLALVVSLLMMSSLIVGSAIAKEATAARRLRASDSTASLRSDSPNGFSRFHMGRTDYVSGEVLVQYRRGVSSASKASLRNSVQGRLLQRLPVRGLELVKVRGDMGMRAAIARLSSDPDVAFAEPNYIYTAQATPNDPDYLTLWGLNNTGQIVEGVAGVSDADIDAPEAWDITTGSPEVTVAVVDTGVAYDHPDLAPNMLSGYDFIDGDDDPMDDQGHGTHVAGTIAAVGNNGIGVSGVAWNVKILPVRVLGEQGGTNATVTAGIKYAVQHGADVVNMSLGGGGSSRAMSRAISNGSDTLFVVAAGNEGSNNEDIPSYPCNYPAENLICVAATDSDDTLAGFSNFGKKSVDIAAPGVNIYSSKPASNGVFYDGFEDGGQQWITDGTSFWGVEDYPFGLIASDSPGRRYKNNTDSWIDSVQHLDLTGRSGCYIGYWLYLDTQLDKDGMIVQASTDGQTWETIDGWTGFTDGLLPFAADMSMFDGASDVTISFRMLSNRRVRADGAYVDDVTVECQSGAAYDANSYQYLMGTSMATPHVAGVAALVQSADLTLTPLGIKQAIIDGADANAGLTGKLVYAKRLNALGALQQIAP